MYEVKFKQEDVKESTIVIVDSTESLAIIEAKLMSEYEVALVETVSIRKYAAIFENSGAHFYQIKVLYEDTSTGKMVPELYLQQADDLNEARELLLNSLSYTPEFAEVKVTKIVKKIDG